MRSPFAALALLALLGAGAPPPESAAPSPAAAATTAPEGKADREPMSVLVRRIAAAYGGDRAQLRTARTRAEGKVRSPLHPGEPGRLLRIFERPSRLRLEIRFGDDPPEVRVLEGARAFRYGSPAPGPVLAVLQLQAARLDLPALLAERLPQLTDQGEVTHQGQRLRVLGLELAAGSRLEVGVEPRSARILYVRGLAQAGPRQLEVFTVFGDFRTVEGALVPFGEEGWANGEEMGEVELEKVELLDELPAGAFEP